MTAMVLLLMVAVIVSTAFQQMNRQKDWVAHTYEVINLMQGVLSGMKDIQSAQRGYVITGNDSYLEPYRVSLPQIPRDMHTLDSMLSDNPEQLVRLNELSTHVNARIQIAQQVIQLYKDKGQAAAIAGVKLGTGKHEMDQIRTIIGEMTLEEKWLLDDRRRAMDKYTRSTMITGIAGLTICFLLLSTAFYQINREAIKNMELQQALREESIRDPLTGFFNRRYMEETLGREIARSERNKAPLSVLVLDIDFFKKINDGYGHDGGDAVLVDFSRMVADSIRQEDIGCRMGGEEFVVVMPGAAAKDALAKAQEICKATRSMGVEFQGRIIPLTVSIGVATYPDQVKTSKEIIQNADMALYQAKNAGRDQVVVYQA